jgi:hypothetical protein
MERSPENSSRYPMIHLRLDEKTHRRIKIVVAQRTNTIQQLVEDLIRREIEDREIRRNQNRSSLKVLHGATICCCLQPEGIQPIAADELLDVKKSSFEVAWRNQRGIKKAEKLRLTFICLICTSLVAVWHVAMPSRD